MRKNAPRKWLHAILDLLPVIMIPVFMIFSHRHDSAITSTYTKQEPVYYESNEVDSFDDLVVDNIYQFDYKDSQPNYDNLIRFSIKYIQPLSYTSNTVSTTTGSVNNVVNIFDYNNNHYFRYFYVENGVSKYVDYYNFVGLIVYNNNANKQDIYTYLSYTSQQIVSSYQDITYNFDKDIMGAFINNFNFTIDKYFNMGNVFNLTGVYNWFNTNIFNGNAPQVVYSVWNIALYEFVMDLLFLLYALFMFFIDICQDLIERCFKSGKGD